MKLNIALLITLLLAQGCTLIGVALDDKMMSSKTDSHGTSLAEIGLEADIEIAKQLISNKLSSNKSNNGSGCKTLKGDEKSECYKISSQLNKSIQKHVNQ